MLIRRNPRRSKSTTTESVQQKSEQAEQPKTESNQGKTAAIEIVVYASFISNRITDIASGCVFIPLASTDVIARVIITGETPRSCCDQPQSSATEKASETEPREDPLGEERGKYSKKPHQKMSKKRKLMDDQAQDNQPVEEAKKDEGAVEESTAPKDGENQQANEGEVNAEATEPAAPPVENSGEDKPDGVQAGEQSEAEKPAEQSGNDQGENRSSKRN
ncbi:hypothetical protein OS493_020181 [Desmophyllum pertusum]|uniref:Uncharacterized protein n=1 Tax=Desmophyllum pertusum TaxID=174260 RepID=A0A9X0D968_9CNID|nr:hypothetical protein OS493_020181 [Desmophyllum pertusum]